MSMWADVPNTAHSNLIKQVACRGHQAQCPVSCCMAGEEWINMLYNFVNV
jgi:hypothetical protein